MSVVHGIRLGTGEQVIRQYEASRLVEPKATGYIIATNRRIIFTGNSESTLSSSIMVRDTKIDNITGVIGGITRERSIMAFIIAFIVAMFSLMLLTNEFVGYGIAGLLIAAFIGYKGFKAVGVRMYMVIMSEQSKAAIKLNVAGRQGLFSKIADDDTYLSVFAAGPGAHTQQMIREIGALIQDIQTHGEEAVAMWSTAPVAESVPQPTTNTVAAATDLMKTTTSKIKDATVATTEAAKKMKEEATRKKQQRALCNCGHQNTENAMFCAECGQSLGQTQ